MQDNSVLWLELVVGLVVSFSLLGIFIWAVRGGQFDDNKKMMDGLLFDSTDDLQDAIKKEQKVKDLKEKKKNSLENSTEDKKEE
jgi:cbb3-type cytochrome oxidase maturation protein